MAALANYNNHQAEFLEYVVRPLFKRYFVFTTDAFKEDVLKTAAVNLKAWRAAASVGGAGPGPGQGLEAGPPAAAGSVTSGVGPARNC